MQATAPSGAQPRPVQVAVRQLTWGRFTGREYELQRLKDAADASLGGNSVTVFIGGEPGIGKTRLAHEAGMHASAAGHSC